MKIYIYNYILNHKSMAVIVMFVFRLFCMWGGFLMINWAERVCEEIVKKDID